MKITKEIKEELEGNLDYLIDYGDLYEIDHFIDEEKGIITIKTLGHGGYKGNFTIETEEDWKSFMDSPREYCEC